MVERPNKAPAKIAGPYWTFFKWSAMAMAILWALVYAESQSAQNLPNFVYVNF